MEYLTDGRRHLICRPYSIDGHHAMARDLGIARCWYHAGWRPHYDVPVQRQAEIAARCIIVSPKEIVRTIDGSSLAWHHPGIDQIPKDHLDL